MSRAETPKNRELYYHNQMAALAWADLAAQAPPLGLTLTAEGQAAVRFFARDFLISPEAIEPVDGAPVSLDHKSVLAHYLLSRGRGELTGEFLPLGRLTGVVSSGLSPSDNLILPLTREFGDRYETFAQAARKVGGAAEGRAPSGGESWLFHFLPYLPVKIIFFEADEEFPAEVQVRFDSSAPNFVSYECLELMVMVLVEEIRGAAEPGPAPRP